jgi:hypothetical protein
MAIRENTPGYIAMAFPKLFPHGIGDFHDNQGGRTAPNSRHRLLTFGQWGRFVMTWHDGRFAHHRSLGVQNRRFPKWESKPSTQHQHPHRTHDTTDQWREIILRLGRNRRIFLLLLLLSGARVPRPE